MTCQFCHHEFCWQCCKEYTYDHYENSWCTQYGKSATLHYAKAVGRILVNSALPFLNVHSDSSYYSDSDSDSDGSDSGTIGNIIGERMAEVKEEMGEKLSEAKEDFSEKWENTKEKATETLVRWKSLWDK